MDQRQINRKQNICHDSVHHVNPAWGSKTPEGNLETKAVDFKDRKN